MNATGRRRRQEERGRRKAGRGERNEDFFINIYVCCGATVSK
jgi:hypothetical protein